ncbi:MAG TPA: GlsB/YeaQ/YmgE family stress response membrane protein [Chloroflexota bacterium]
MGILVWIIVGAIAGFLASKVLTGKGMGLLWDIVVGIVGAFLGGWLAGLVGIPVDTGTFTVGGLVAAFVGAVILLIVFRALTSHGRVRA